MLHKVILQEEISEQNVLIEQLSNYEKSIKSVYIENNIDNVIRDKDELISKLNDELNNVKLKYKNELDIKNNKQEDYNTKYKLLEVQVEKLKTDIKNKEYKIKILTTENEKITNSNIQKDNEIKELEDRINLLVDDLYNKENNSMSPDIIADLEESNIIRE